MSLDLSTKPRHERPDIRLRKMTVDGKEEFRLDVATRLLGYGTDVARAEFLEISDRTIRRARRGRMGDDLMATVVAKLRPHYRRLAMHDIEVSLDGLFEVTDGRR